MGHKPLPVGHFLSRHTESLSAFQISQVPPRNADRKGGKIIFVDKNTSCPRHATGTISSVAVICVKASYSNIWLFIGLFCPGLGFLRISFPLKAFGYP